MTTLAERRMIGDLIRAFKIARGFVDFGQNLKSSFHFQV